MTRQRDVVLVTVDSLRADHCGFMGYDRDTTPTLDRLADRGLSFENATAPAGATSGSVPAFFTGVHPADRRWFDDPPDKAEWIRRHMAAHETLPERFSRLGYHTAGFTANPWTSRFFGFETGFDHFEDFMDTDASRGLVKSGLKRDNAAVSLLAQLLNWWQGQDMFMTWEALYDDIDAWLDTAERPFFLWIFLVDVHVPYLPPAGYRRRSRLLTYLANLALFAGYEPPAGSWLGDVLVDAYDDTVAYTDTFFDRLITDLGDDPLVAIHADHGEELGEFGTYGHGANMYDADVHVPLVVANGPTDTVSEPFSLLRLGELLESLATTGGYEYDQLTDPYATCRNYDPTYALRGRRWKYVERERGDGLLYDLTDGESSPFEEEKLAELGRELVRDWRATERERARIAQAADSLVTTDDL